VISRIREASDSLEEDLELEEQVFLAFDREAGEPGFASLMLVAP
jgi:hypothetical protein